MISAGRGYGMIFAGRGYGPDQPPYCRPNGMVRCRQEMRPRPVRSEPG